MSLKNDYRITFQRPGQAERSEVHRRRLTPPEASQAFRDTRLTERMAEKSYNFPTAWKLERFYGLQGWHTILEVD